MRKSAPRPLEQMPSYIRSALMLMTKYVCAYGLSTGGIIGAIKRKSPCKLQTIYVLHLGEAEQRPDGTSEALDLPRRSHYCAGACEASR